MQSIITCLFAPFFWRINIVMSVRINWTQLCIVKYWHPLLFCVNGKAASLSRYCLEKLQQCCPWGFKHFLYFNTHSYLVGQLVGDRLLTKAFFSSPMHSVFLHHLTIIRVSFWMPLILMMYVCSRTHKHTHKNKHKCSVLSLAHKLSSFL